MPTQAELATMLFKLKQNLREDSSPFFEDGELLNLLENASFNVGKATYNGLLLKAQDDSIKLPSGLSLPNNENYWLRLAKLFRSSQTGTVKSERP